MLSRLSQWQNERIQDHVKHPFLGGIAAYVTSRSFYVTLIHLGYYSRACFFKKTIRQKCFGNNTHNGSAAAAYFVCKFPVSYENHVYPNVPMTHAVCLQRGLNTLSTDIMSVSIRLDLLSVEKTNKTMMSIFS